jgi:formate dehydrogenase major subunit
MYPRNLEFADCIVIEGSNMAECHPVAFRWPMQAKANGAKLIHVDPRFTRTSAMADLHAPIRAGTDIAFLGGVIHYVLNNERWNTEPFFKDYLVHYTNAATIVAEDFRDTEGTGRGLLRSNGIHRRYGSLAVQWLRGHVRQFLLAVRPH